MNKTYGSVTPWELVVVVSLTGLYLWIFCTDIPNGEPLVYIRNLEEGRFVLNPNLANNFYGI